MYETDDDLIELLLIPKVGRARAKALFAAGYKNLGDIAKADVGKLARVPGIGSELARSLKNSASDISQAKPAPDKLETSKEILICPMCGSMVSAGSSSCQGCGIAFSDDVEELVEPEITSRDVPRKDDELDGFWYRDSGKLFICPECGSLVADGSGSCPKCGVLFGGDDEEEEPPVPEKQVAEGPDGYWYKERDSIFMCPNCGAFIKKDAEGCDTCGIIFEAGEESPEDIPEPSGQICPMCKSETLAGADICKECGFEFAREREADGFWYKERDSIFMCPDCGAFVPKSADKCGNCGAVLEQDDEDVPMPEPKIGCPKCGEPVPEGARACAKCGSDFSENDEKDGFWYKDSVALFICPNCGAFLSEAADMCMNCGIVFEAEGAEAATDPLEKSKLQAETSARDRALEEEVDKLIELVEIEDELDSAAQEPRGEAAEPPVENTVAGGDKAESLYLCPICGAFVQSSMLKCPSCKTVFDDIEEMELEPVGSVTDVAPEQLAKEMAAEIREIEAELLDRPREEKKGGVSKDFLDRWKKLDSIGTGTSLQQTKRPSKDVSVEDIEKELVLEEPIAPEEDLELEAEIDALAAVPSSDASSLEIKARELAAAGKLEEAVACLDRASELDHDRELEFKRQMLELMGLGPKETAVDLSEIAALDDIGNLSIDDELITENLQARLEEIDSELLRSPENSGLWQEKGEVLEKLGRHEEAVDCYDRSIGYTYAELRKETKDLSVKRPMPQIGIGLTNGEGRVNGRVNGLLTQRGLINGTSAGRTNGITNGIGRIGGMINGLAKGRTNGRVNGLTNGRTNGRSPVSGRTNGRINGNVGRVNGAGLVNGRSNGLINGGLVNGLGLVNGEGMVDGSGSLRRLRSRRRERMQWRYRLTAIALFVTLVLMMSMLGNLMVDEDLGRINIDGNFNDWNDIESYYNFMGQSSLNPDLRILETRLVSEDGRIDVYVVFGSDGFSGLNGTVSSLWAFIDIDPAADTGYSIDGMGIDLIAEIYGWDGTVRGTGLLRFDNQADSDDWNGFSGIGAVSTHAAGSRLEAGIGIPRDMQGAVANPRVLVMAADSYGNADLTNYLMTDGPGGLVACFTHTGPDIIQPGNGLEFGELVLSSHSDADGGFTEFMFNVTGNAGTPYIQNPILRGESGQIIPATFAQGSNSEFTLTLREPQVPGHNSTLILTLEADVLPAAVGMTAGIELAGAIGTSAVTVRNLQTRIHNVGVSELAVDGAFGEWEDIGSAPDAAGDVVTENPNATFINANVDLASAGLVLAGGSMGQDSLYFRLAVNGAMLGGDSVPTVRQRPGPITPPGPADSDRDSVPDTLDAYPLDFSNDGIPDTESFAYGNQRDADDDGIGDYPMGDDWWLNTTLPATFPVPYAGENVSIYIGPIESVHVMNIGDDRAYIMIDADNDPQTGLDLKGGWGIDYSAVISGKGGRILASELYRYDPAQATNWAFAGNVTAASDWARLEGTVDLAAMGIAAGQNFSIYISMEDWKGSYDGFDAAMEADNAELALPAGGTRSPAGDNVVINELVAAPSTGEWIELCNPTSAAINIGGWRLRMGNTNLVIFPVNTILGPFGSGTEYYAATFYSTANNLPDNGATIMLQQAGTWITRDSFTYSALGNGQSWARYKNATWGMPTDTDTAGDYYISALPSFRAPNDRRAPSIVVEKAADSQYEIPGGQVTYTVWYNNTGDGNARHVWVNDTLPAGMSYVSSSVPYASFSGQIYRWYFTQVTPGLHSFTVTVQVDAAVPTGTVLTNSVLLQYTDQLSRLMGTSSDSAAVTIQVPPPGIVLSKVAVNTSPIPGSNADFIIYYNNTGPGGASDVWLNDTLPAGLSYVSASPAPSSVSGQNVFWHFLNVAPGNYVATLTAQVGIAVVPGTVLTNAASCDYKDMAGISLPRVTDQASVTVASPASMAVINEIAPNPNPEWVEICNPTSSPINIGGWRIYATNFIRYTFPAGTTLGAWGSGSEYIVATMTQSNRFSNSGELVRLTTGTGAEVDRTTYPAVVNGQTWSRFKHEDTGRPIDTGNSADWYISNNAWLVPEGPTPAAPNDRKRPIMDVDKAANTAVAQPGQTITYTVWYNNTGDGNAKDVWVNDTLPAGIDYVSASPAPTSIAGQSLVWFFGTVLHDSANYITITARMNALPTDGDIISNVAGIVYHDSLRRPMGSGSASADVTCSRPVISVEKVADVQNALAGGTVVYTVFYNNTGSAAAGSLWINDTLPAGVTFIGSSIMPDTVSGLALGWHLTNVAPGAHSLTVTVTVNATAASGTITNWAFLDYTSGYGYGLEPSSSSATVVIPEMRNLAIPIFGIVLITFIYFRKKGGNNARKI